jgi:hypothetical protein
MRVTSLIFLLAIGGGIAFCFIHKPTRDWITTHFHEAAHQADGFPLAKTPKEAADNFVRAVKERKYKSAARYCSEDYAKMLEKADAAGNSVGTALDRIYNGLENKHFSTLKTHTIIVNMDPFVTDFKIKPDSIKETKKGELAEVIFESEPRPVPKTGRGMTEDDIKRIDPKLYQKFPLMPKNIFMSKHEIKYDKKEECWKIVFTPQTKDCDYFVENYKRYLETYRLYSDELLQERKLIDAAERELLDVIARNNIDKK